MKQKLFVYGSLMSESVFKTVIQLPVDYLINKHPARLYGYLRFQVEGQAYPGIVKADQQTFVDGELIELPSDPSDCQRWLERLDLFEGIDEGLYVRIIEDNVVYNSSDSTACQAFVYVYTGDPQTITDKEWDFNLFDAPHFLKTQCFIAEN